MNQKASEEEKHPAYHAGRMPGRSNGWRNPFGDGKAAERIVRVMAMVRRG